MWREMKKKKQLTNCHVQLSPALITEPDQKATTELRMARDEMSWLIAFNGWVREQRCN